MACTVAERAASRLDDDLAAEQAAFARSVVRQFLGAYVENVMSTSEAIFGHDPHSRVR